MKHKNHIKKISSILIVLLITLIGVHILLKSYAQTPYASMNASDGVVTQPAHIQPDSTAIGGKSVQFNDGYITRSGTKLMLDGKTFNFIGYNPYGMNGCYNGSNWSTAQLDAYFSILPPNGMSRIFAYQRYGIAPIANIITEATKYNQHLIISLGNDDGGCDTGYVPEPYSFYQSGWQGSYLTWVNTLVPTYKNNPTVAMWEIANEPGNITTVDEPTMQAYLSGASAAIKAVDPNHLVETGVNNAKAMGGGEANYQNAQDSPNIDVLSIHDYAWDYENKAIESSNFAIAQTAAINLNKPFIVGEVGVESGVNCTVDLTLSQRVTYLQTKTDNYFKGLDANGKLGTPTTGIMYWDYEPADYYNKSCAYEIFPGDPMISFVHNYPLP
jgi:hypothetical protein